MNRLEIARRSVVALKVPTDWVLACLDAMADDVTAECSAGRRVVWPNFGTFAPLSKQPRVYTTPKPRKRADRPGETADKYRQVSLLKWSLGFYPSLRVRIAIATVPGRTLPERRNVGIGVAVVRRVAARVGLSTVEVAEIIDEITKQLLVAAIRGVTVYMDGFGMFERKRRAGRMYNVRKKGGGRQSVWVAARSRFSFTTSAGWVTGGEAV